LRRDLMNIFRSGRRLFPVLLAVLALLGGASGALLGVCGPFTDVSDAAFCPFVLEIFTLGITTGTTPTTYDPGATVSRLQMAAFLSRTVDRTLQRLHPRSTLRQYWTPQNAQAVGTTTFTIPGTTTIWLPLVIESDGTDLWAGGSQFLTPTNSLVARVRASDGAVLGIWTGMTSVPQSVLVALGKVFMPGFGAPGKLYGLDPTQPPGAVGTLASNIGDNPQGIAFDGTFVWTANNNGTVSKITPSASAPWPVTTVPGFTSLRGILYDGANIWVTDKTVGTLLKLNASGTVLQTVTVGATPDFPSFDGTNIWVPNEDSNSVSVVRASSGAVLATLTGNGMNSPSWAAFDGQRVLVTNFDGSSVSLWKAADLTPIGVFDLGTAIPYGACSDGVNFWVAALLSIKRF
jgi:hypothetical protein